MVVYRSIPTSNRNALAQLGPVHNVVYRSIPTSNRNTKLVIFFQIALYIVLFLHQTATATTHSGSSHSCISFYSYIKPQLVPTTWTTCWCCISFYSYIKPQLAEWPHIVGAGCISFYSYIKPQLSYVCTKNYSSCISFYSYIKPQRLSTHDEWEGVVYRSIPTSNRNIPQCRLYQFYVVYRSIPTSNRNLWSAKTSRSFVVYRSIPTSNRNLMVTSCSFTVLYIVLFLHQTATNT